MSDEPSKLVTIDKQPNNEIVHALGLGKTDGTAHQPLDPCAQVEVLALDFLRVFLPHVMGLCIEMPLVGPHRRCVLGPLLLCFWLENPPFFATPLSVLIAGCGF